jgi:death-on-curing protein
MIDIKDVLNIHNILIDKFGGSKGIRDIGLLESAINRPFATFDNKDLYPTPTEKAAAILESILINHPFLDGNKRTAYVLMRLILLENGLDI